MQPEQRSEPSDPDEAVAGWAQAHYGLVTRRQALSRGLSSSAIGRRLDSGMFEAVRPGVYRLRGSPDSFQQRVLAAVWAFPNSVASHGTAATLLGLPFGHQRVELSVTGRSGQLPGAVVHYPRRLGDLDRETWKAIPTTTLTRTVIDVAAELGRDEQAALTDYVLAERRTSLAFLVKRVAALGTRGRSGPAAYLALLRSYQGRDRVADSEAQRLLGRIIAQYGLEAPEVEYEIRLDNGEVRYADAAWPRHRLMVEVQSYRHHAGMEDFGRDQERNNDLVVGGWRIVNITPHAIRTDPAEVARVIGSALRSGRDDPDQNGRPVQLRTSGL